LVLTLLVVLGALSMPAFEGAFARSRLRHAGDQVRAAWSRARLASLEAGQPHTFRCVWQSGQYHVQAIDLLVPTPIEELNPLPEVAVAAPEDEATDVAVTRIAEGVKFAGGIWAGAVGQVLAVEDQTADHQPGEWSDPIYFFPDGTTSDAIVILENEQGDRLRLSMRGLTGVSLAGEVGVDEDDL
jgi:hypothetical protein